MSEIAQLLSTGEVATILGCSTAKIKRLALTGELQPAAKMPGKTGAYVFDASTVGAFVRKAHS